MCDIVKIFVIITSWIVLGGLISWHFFMIREILLVSKRIDKGQDDIIELLSGGIKLKSIDENKE